MAVDETPAYPAEPWYLGGSLDVSVFLVPEHELPAFAMPQGRRPLMVGRRVVVGVASVRYVPGGVLAYDELLVALRLSRLLPTAVQDWLDDAIGTDRIGLGGDPEVRARYLREVDQRLG
ncbi:hypothetical protein [Microbacterium sp. CIAB417]|uniref:hypothetical protein n=1 Tax=Microbacterium sp. CIAB417 TaxID=2860287 RepID=UPI001FAC9853|nr:hypothetical protein [Microbacterium sp. CIAB417]